MNLKNVIVVFSTVLMESHLCFTWTIYKHGQYGAPPPILIPIKFDWSFLMITDPDDTVIPLHDLHHRISFVSFSLESESFEMLIFGGHLNERIDKVTYLSIVNLVWFADDPDISEENYLNE